MANVALAVREAELALLNAPFEAGGWQTAMAHVAVATDSSGAQLIGVGGPLVVPLNVVVGDFAGPWKHFTDLSLYGPCNWRLNSSGPEGSIQHERHYAAYAARHDTSVYDDAVADLDVPYGCQSPFLLEDDRLVGLSLLRRRRDGMCDADTLRAFARLRTQAGRAVRAQLAMDGEAARLMLGDLETVTCATLLLDRSGAVCALTAAAERALEVGPFTLAGRAFRLQDSERDRYFQRAMARLLMGDGRNDPMVHQARIDGGRWSLAVARLPGPRHSLGFEPVLAVTLRRHAGPNRALDNAARNATLGTTN